MESGVPNGARIELLSAYNSLTDKHLTGYFNNTRIRRHLQRVGLITRSGRIVPDKEYRHKLIQRAHQRHVRECLAQAIFHKVLEMERVHQIEIKRKLEEFTRRERVHKIKLDRSKRYEEDVIRILSPRPPTGPRSGRRQHSGPEGEHTESSESPGSSRPNTAPGKMQRPVRLKPIHSNSTTASRRRGSPYRRHDSSNETDHTFSYTMDKDSQRHRTATDFSRGITPYCLPVINNFVTPVPPPTKRKERGLRASGTLRGRRLRPTTAPLAPDITEESPMLRTSVLQSGVCVNMVFFGKTVHLSHDLIDLRDEVKVFQQHCGGENLCVYKGKLREGDTFQFVSRRHRGFPFSLTFFLNGLQVERLSSCCEFKHKKGSRLGGRHGHFGFTSVEGASPCYKCIIAMGLDKKPTPPPKRIKEDREAPSPEEPTQHRRTSPEEPTQHRRTSPEDPTQHTPEKEKESESTPKDPAAHTEPELSQPQEMETKIEEDIQPEEDKPRDDYEEDFEADDEGPAEDGEVKEEKISPARERDASDSEEDKKEGDRRSRSASSSSGSDRQDSETEADNKGAQTAEQPKEPEGDAPKVYQEETPVPPAEEKEQQPAASDTSAAEKDSPVPPLTNGSPRAKESGSDGSPGESTELEVSDTSAPLGNGGKVDNDTSGDVEQGKEADKLIDEHTEEQEPERAKSVQEKVAEAILKEAQCSSEPELSDTTTEEEEDSTEKRQQQDNNDAVPEKVVNCEASPVAAESAEDQREANSELKEEDKSPPEPQDNEHGVNSEMEKTEDTEMAEPAEDNKQDTTQDSEHGVNVELEKVQDTETAVPDEDNKENTEEKESSEKETVDDKTSEPQSHNEAKPTDTEIDEEKKQEEEKVTAEADSEPTETQCTKEDESPPSEPENKEEQTAAQDKTEVEEVPAIETAEMKPEPQEDLTCEETPVADAEKQGDGEDVPGGPSEGSGDTATVQAEKTADTTEVKAEDEVITEDEKEQAPEEALGAEANNDDLQQESVKDNQTSEKAEEESEKSIKENVEDDKVEREKSDDNEVGGKETNQDETAEGDKGEVKEQTGEVNSEQEDKHENKEEERIKAEEDNGNTEEKAKEEPEVGNSDEGDKVTDEAKVEEVETSERNDEGSKVQGSEDIKDKIDPENAEEKVTTADTVVEVEGSSHGAAEQLENNAEGELEKGNKSANMTDDNVGDHKADDEEQETENTEDKPEESNMEADSVQKENENERAHSEKDERETTAAEIDTENGERDSMKASDEQKESQEDGAKTTSQEKHDVDGENTEENNTSSETTKEEPDKVEPEQGSEDHEKTSDNCNDDKADQVAETNLENESKIEDTDADVKSESQSEEPNKDKDMEESKQHPDENTEVTDCKESAPEDEDKGSDINEKNNNILNNVNEVILVTSEPHSSQPAADDLDNMTHKSDEEKEKSSAPSDSKIEKQTNSEANATDDAPSAVDGDTGADTEEASKPSEEGASVVLKPQAESAQLTDKGADQPKESALGKEGDVPETAKTEENNATPESLEIEDSRNLVTNWVTLHQTTKSFQKFSDPIEVESTNTTVLQKSASPLQMLTIDEHKVGDEINAESVEKEPQPTANDGSESKDNTKVEDLHSDLKSNRSKDDAPSESQPTEDAPQVKEESGVTQQAPITETDNDEEDTTRPANKEMSTEEHNDKSGLFEGEKHQEPAANDGSEPKDSTKVEDLHSDLKSNHSKDDAPSESQPTEDALQVKEETGVTEPVPITESENDGEDATRGANKEMCTEEHKETSELFEGGKDQDATTQKDTEQSDNCKTEMESITNQSEASVKSDRGPENQREEEITQDDPGLNSKQTMIEGIKNVPSPPISEGHQENSESPEKLDPSGIITTGEPENTENGDKKEEDSTELTEVSDLTLTSKSEEGSQDDSHTGQTQTNQTEGSINGDNKTVQLIEDKKDLNKDPLSVEETSLLGHNTYALLTTARTEND